MSISILGRFGTTILVGFTMTIGFVVCRATLIGTSATSTEMSKHIATDIAWTADGQHLVWRSRSHENRKPIVATHDLMDSGRSRVIWGEESEDLATHVSVSADGEHVLVATHGRLWWMHLRTHERTCLAIGGFIKTAISHDSQMLAGATDRGQIHLFDIKQGSTIQVSDPPPSMVNQLEFSCGDNVLLSAFNDGSVYVWDVCSGQCVRAIRPIEPGGCAAAFLPDGQRILSTSSLGCISIWDTFTGTVYRNEPHGINGITGVRCLDVASDGSIAAWAGLDHRIVVWDLNRMTIRLLIDNPAVALSLQLSPDGKQLAVAGLEPTIRIYSMSTGKELKRVESMPVYFSD